MSKFRQCATESIRLYFFQTKKSPDAGSQHRGFGLREGLSSRYRYLAWNRFFCLGQGQTQDTVFQPGLDIILIDDI